MLLPKRLAAGIADGSVTLLFRRWNRREAIVGHRYRTAAGRIEVRVVTEVAPDEITDEEAARAGYPGADAVRADLRGDPGAPVTRVEFALAEGPDPRAELAADAALDAAAVAALDARLARMDAGSPRGTWTRATLQAIAARPGIRAGDLATDAGVERLDYKRDVRRLKALGLTESLPIGYRLSPRGAAYLAAQTTDGAPVDRVRRLALALPDAVERPSWGTPAFFAGARGKLFARMREDGTTLVLRIDPDERPLLLAAEPRIFHLTPHYDGSPLVLVHLAAIGDDELGERLEEAWALAAPRRLVRAWETARAGTDEEVRGG